MEWIVYGWPNVRISTLAIVPTNPAGELFNKRSPPRTDDIGIERKSHKEEFNDMSKIRKKYQKIRKIKKIRKGRREAINIL